MSKYQSLIEEIAGNLVQEGFWKGDLDRVQGFVSDVLEELEATQLVLFTGPDTMGYTDLDDLVCDLECEDGGEGDALPIYQQFELRDPVGFVTFVDGRVVLEV